MSQETQIALLIRGTAGWMTMISFGFPYGARILGSKKAMNWCGFILKKHQVVSNEKQSASTCCLLWDSLLRNVPIVFFVGCISKPAAVTGGVFLGIIPNAVFLGIIPGGVFLGIIPGGAILAIPWDNFGGAFLWIIPGGVLCWDNSLMCISWDNSWWCIPWDNSWWFIPLENSWWYSLG